MTDSTETDNAKNLVRRTWSCIKDAAHASPSLQRLKNTIPIFEKDLAAIEKMSGKSKKDSDTFGWVQPAKSLLQEVERAVDKRNAERGWRCLKAADRFTWYGLMTYAPDLLEAKVKAIANEAEDERKGVTKWRRDSIKALLKDKQGEIIPVSDKQVHNMIEAKRLLDEHYDNVYQRLAILRTRLTLLFFISFGFLVIWFVLSPPVPLTLTSGDGSDSFATLGNSPAKFWGVIVLAGCLGALISAFTSAIGTDPKRSSIPVELSTLTITSARLIVAALSALAITLFLGSGIILNLGQQDYSFLIAIAVVAGFSDRLLLNAIEKVTKPT